MELLRIAQAPLLKLHDLYSLSVGLKCNQTYLQEAQNLVDVDFDEIWGYDVRDVSESDSAGDAEVIKAEDVL